MEEEENILCRFGTALEPLDEDEVPSKKPINIEDQIVTDKNGKRRFHGAFTGGFSAGFWNTVGSLEGWTPQSFKSSRAEKAGTITQQRPTDFMDDEDLGEFGIAPQRVQTTEEFTPQDSASSSKANKRKIKSSSGPIPGVPVLHQLLQPAKDNIARRLLKKMGWKDGQGIGARQSRQDKKKTAERNAREMYVMKMYGCELGEGTTKQKPLSDHSSNTESDSEISDNEITFAPDDFEPFVCAIKDNSFGLGYSGLDRNTILNKRQPQEHINLFGGFEIMEKGAKKLSIRGQAFGVGALEEEDEDIYARDDMTKYDFSLEHKKKIKPKQEPETKRDRTIIDGFDASKIDDITMKRVFRVSIPSNFKPRNYAVRRSRFEPLDDERVEIIRQQTEHLKKGLGRHDLNPESRGNILGESSSKPEQAQPMEASSSQLIVSDVGDNKINETPVEQSNQKPTKATNTKPKKLTYLERVNLKYKALEEKSAQIKKFLNSNSDRFTTGEVLNNTEEKPIELDENTRKENENIKAKAEKLTEGMVTEPAVFKPFLNNVAKQERYEKFIKANLRNDDAITKFLGTIQPLNMIDWDREMEKKEFLQARKIYKPLEGSMSNRFITEGEAPKEPEEKPLIITENRVEVTRTKKTWKPASLLCKRFCLPEPYGGTMADEKVVSRSRFSIFDYVEASVNRKDDFVTPCIRPTKAEKPRPIVVQPNHREFISDTTSCNNSTMSNEKRISAKDMFVREVFKDDESLQIQRLMDSLQAKRSNEDKSSRTASKDNRSSSSSNNNPPSSSGVTKSTTKTQAKSKYKTELERKIDEAKDKHPSEKKDLFKSIFDSSSEDEADETVPKNKSELDTQKLEDLTKVTAPILITTHKTEISILRSTSPARGLFSGLSNKKQEEKSIESSKEGIKQCLKTTAENVPKRIIFKKREERMDDDNDKNPAVEDDVPKKIIFTKRDDDDNDKNLPVEDDVPKRIIFTKREVRTDDDNDQKPDNSNAYGPQLPSNFANGKSHATIKVHIEEPVEGNIDQKLLQMIKKSKKHTKIVEEWVEKSDAGSSSSKKKKKKEKSKDKKKSKKNKKDKKHKDKK